MGGIGRTYLRKIKDIDMALELFEKLGSAARSEEITSLLFDSLRKRGFEKCEPFDIEYAHRLTDENGILFKGMDFDGKALVFGGDSIPLILGQIQRDEGKRLYFSRTAYNLLPDETGRRTRKECGACVVNLPSPESAAELILASYESLKALGLNGKIFINHARLFKSIADSYHPLERVEQNDIALLLRDGKSNKINDACATVITAIAKLNGGTEAFFEAAESINNKESADCLAQLFDFSRILEKFGLDGRYQFDFSYLAQESYYDGMIFDIEIGGESVVRGGSIDDRNCTCFKYDLEKLLNLCTESNEDRILLGVADSGAALAKANEITAQLTESDVRVFTLYKVSYDELKNYATNRNVENIIYINSAGEIR